MKTFREALRTRDLTVSAELELDTRATAASIADQARVLAPAVDAVQITDNPSGRVHLSPLVAAGIVLDNEIDAVLHMTCRDRNRIALQSDLLGAAALGVESLLLMRGRGLPSDAPDKPAAVFDWGAKKLISAAHGIGTGPGAGRGTGFYIGSIATAFNPTRGWQPLKIAARADAGVKFIQTQLCFDIDTIRRYMASLVGAKLLQRVSVIIGIAPIPSAEIAEWLATNLRGAVVPDDVTRRLKRAADARREGIDICAEMIREIASVPGVSGVNLMSFGNPESIVQSVELSGLRRDAR